MTFRVVSSRRRSVSLVLRPIDAFREASQRPAGEIGPLYAAEFDMVGRVVGNAFEPFPNEDAGEVYGVTRPNPVVNRSGDDARTLSREVVERAAGLPSVQIDRVVCTLGYSVMPEWRTVFERTWQILAPGGRYAIMDWFFEDSGPFTRFVDWTAASDVHRRFWEPLESCALDFERETLFAGRLQIVSGRKSRN